MTLMCIKYTDQQDPPDTEWPERGTDKYGGNNECLCHQKILI